MTEPSHTSPRIVGRYALYDAIASGGMATVYVGRLLGPVGFSRTVAIKSLHPQYAADPSFVAMFLDEARLAARIRHPNVVPTLDVVATSTELFLVMDYCAGETLSRLMMTLQKQGERIPLTIVMAIISGVLHGLHAAHEATNERGEPLSLVHRDVSPQNILIGSDGIPRILDFGVAKASGRSQETRGTSLKGKLSYMPPEQLHGFPVERQADVYAASIVLWEMLTGRRLFAADNEAEVVVKVLNEVPRAPSVVLREDGVTFTDATTKALESLDAIVLRGLARDPKKRFPTALEMAAAINPVSVTASSFEVAQWVEKASPSALRTRALKVAEIEQSSATLATPTGDLPSMPSANDIDIRISVASIPPPRGNRTRKIVWAGIAIVACTLMTIVALRFGKSSAEAPVGIRTADARDLHVASASAAPVVSAAPAALLLDAAVASALPVVSVAPVVSVVPTPTTTAVAAPTQKPRDRKAECASPTYRDAQGFVHFKPECM